MYLKIIAKADKADGCLTKVLMHSLEIQTYPDVIQFLSWRDGNNWIYSSAPQLHFCKYHSIYFSHLFESEQNVRGERQ